MLFTYLDGKIAVRSAAVKVSENNRVYSNGLMARKYELKRRAERQEETRRRITEAAVELHGTVGPARASISAIAEKAGVQRLTVYRHFPDERALFAACTGHYLSENPPPDPEPWTGIADPEDRLRAALAEVYGYYRRNEPMMSNSVRDAEAKPVIYEVLGRSSSAGSGCAAFSPTAEGRAAGGTSCCSPPSGTRSTLRRGARSRGGRGSTTGGRSR